MRLARRSTIAALSLALPLSLAACGNSGSDTTSGSASPSASSSSSTSSSSTTTEDMAGKPFGAGCQAVPADGKGSFSGMALFADMRRRASS